MTTDDPSGLESPQRKATDTAEDDVEGHLRAANAADGGSEAPSRGASKADESDDTEGHGRY